jgi:hypothetical protein|nr:MAG TPA: hypothetical protein [Caudoviricetes sp.]
MTDFYTNENRERILRALPDGWAEAFYSALRLRRNSPIADFRAAYNQAQKLISNRLDTQEVPLPRSILFEWAVMEARKTPPTHQLQAEAVYDLIQALTRPCKKQRLEALADACRALCLWTNIRRVTR